uniref:Alkylated DNA repair protein AlkB homologue 8 N-terminal domain-containing protein n=1 Tax=Knipowitschia caucasica TaxID=637954 RepID=A0AAV2MTT2_KNICA
MIQYINNIGKLKPQATSNGPRRTGAPPRTKLPRIKPLRIKPPRIKPPRIKRPRTKRPRTKPPCIKPPRTTPPRTKWICTTPPRTTPPRTTPPRTKWICTTPPRTTPPRTTPPRTTPPRTTPPRTTPPRTTPPRTKWICTTPPLTKPQRAAPQRPALRRTTPHDSVKLIKFADDTTLIGLISNNDESAYRREVDRLVSWCSGNNLELNAQKTVEMIVDFRKSTVPPPPPSVMDSPITSVESFRFLGTTITQDLKWEPTISSLIKKAQQRMYFLRQLRKAKLPAQMLVQFYTAIIESILTSSITVWFAGATVRDKQRLQRIVRSAEEVIGRSLPSLQDLRLFPLHQSQRCSAQVDSHGSLISPTAPTITTNLARDKCDAGHDGPPYLCVCDAFFSSHEVLLRSVAEMPLRQSPHLGFRMCVTYGCLK